MKKIFKILFLVGVILSINSCTAMHTAIKKRNLDVQTKMSKTIFLEPVAPSKRVIFVDIKNTSDKDLNIVGAIKERLQKSGYILTDNPDNAHYMLQANILQVGKSDLRGVANALRAGFGGAVVGGAIGSVSDRSFTSYGSYNSKGAIIGTLVGGIASVVGDALVDDVIYVMITDLQIKERPNGDEVIQQTQNTSTTSGTATKINQTVSYGNAKWKIYRTRIVSTANKVNLEFEEAKDSLEKSLIKSISGIF
ncbi:MAG: conjugal transfer protein TraT [Epsilonproteobacteria bacterium]|nr:conjugal transfer protein TraT [Campylobacterota bacterium]